jgi:ferredoxin-NADP reductase/ferredoxin
VDDDMRDSAQIIGLGIGWLAIGYVMVQAMLFVFQSARRRMRQQRKYAFERAEFCRRVEATARAARATKAIPDWNGWRPFRVAAIVDEARDVRSFYFMPADGRPLAPFAPGQYLTFRLPLTESHAPLVRCYSLSDRPRQDYFRTTIKRIAALAGSGSVQPGRGSNFLHDRVRVGDVLEVRAPAGTFLIDSLSTEPIALIGAGIGITPLVSMLEAILHAGRGREIYAVFGFRNGAEHPFKERLEKLAAEHVNLHLQISYSAPRTSDVLHKDYVHTGRLTIDRLREVLPSNNFRFYVCGPGPLMETLVPALWAWGVPDSHVQFEAFGPASVRSAASTRRHAVAPCEVRFDRSNCARVWDESFNSLLEFGEAAGVVLPSGCSAGSCGECMIGIRNGKVRTLKQPGIDVPAGYCLTCISVPAEALVLDA